MKKRIFLFASSFLLLILLASSTVLAMEHQSGIGSNAQGNRFFGQNTGPLRSCQAKETRIKTRMTHVVDLATNMETVFDSIATRVENYYTNTVIPSGKTVSNYATLIADIATQKASVATALATAQTNATAFSCTNGTPRQQVMQFTHDMQSVKSSLKTYRTSIKNLIVAVHSLTASVTPATSGPTP